MDVAKIMIPIIHVENIWTVSLYATCITDKSWIEWAEIPEDHWLLEWLK